MSPINFLKKGGILDETPLNIARRHPKIESILTLYYGGFPIPETYVLCDTLPQTIVALKRIMEFKKFKFLTIRRDTIIKSIFQGGGQISLNDIENTVDRYGKKGVLFFLEPLDPLDNGYNLNFFVGVDTILIEIVGPKFDASDLQRGHSFPHEIYKYEVKSKKLIRNFIINDEQYNLEFMRRQDKVREKYYGKNYRYIPKDFCEPTDNSFSYEAIEKPLIRKPLNLILKNLKYLSEKYGSDYTIACSYVSGKKRLCFWDVFKANQSKFTTFR